jgi:hypothetical protein
MPDPVQVETATNEVDVGQAKYVSSGKPLGPQIDALFDLREQKKAAEAEVDRIKELMRVQENFLMLEMEANGLQRSTGLKASIGIEESVVPQVEDWETFYAFIRRNNAFELLERRPATGAFREHAERRRDKTVPGVVPFTKRKLSLRVNS